ncbi:MAG TPA: MTAP family purine nucleoside phosphorylase [Longimicrobiales bacterium]|nr:MTAP family purine nucleoside phosphorylase [Longimicrobiales bacterium]
MERLGIVGGSAFLDELPAGLEQRVVDTGHGIVRVHVGAAAVFLRRHGDGEYHLPHRVPHLAHALAFVELGVRRAVGLCSVGGLRPELGPGTVVVPDDYLSFHPPPTSAVDERLHIVPRLDDDLRQRLLGVARATDGPVRDGGVYAETHGPRFETRAEVRLLAGHADMVGMTAASEATIFQERGIAYAILAMVDNHAHGVGAEPLTFEAVERQLARNARRAHAILRALLEPDPRA